jgi:hypothetical protein
VSVIHRNPVPWYLCRPRPHNMNQTTQILRQRCRCLLAETAPPSDCALRTRDHQGLRTLRLTQMEPRVRLQDCAIAEQIPRRPNPRCEEEWNATRHSNRIQNPHRRRRLCAEPRKRPPCHVRCGNSEANTRPYPCQIRECPRRATGLPRFHISPQKCDALFARVNPPRRREGCQNIVGHETQDLNMEVLREIPQPPRTDTEDPQDSTDRPPRATVPALHIRGRTVNRQERRENADMTQNSHTTRAKGNGPRQPPVRHSSCQIKGNDCAHTNAGVSV